MLFDKIITRAGTDAQTIINVRHIIVQAFEAPVAIKPFVEQTIVLPKTVHGRCSRLITFFDRNRRRGGGVVDDGDLVFGRAVSHVGSQSDFILVPLLAGGRGDGSKESIAIATRQCRAGGNAALPFIGCGRSRIGAVGQQRTAEQRQTKSC